MIKKCPKNITRLLKRSKSYVILKVKRSITSKEVSVSKDRTGVRIWINESTHEKLMEEKKRQGGKNLPFVVEELVELGLQLKKTALKAK